MHGKRAGDPSQGDCSSTTVTEILGLELLGSSRPFTFCIEFDIIVNMATSSTTSSSLPSHLSLPSAPARSAVGLAFNDNFIGTSNFHTAEIIRDDIFEDTDYSRGDPFGDHSEDANGSNITNLFLANDLSMDDVLGDHMTGLNLSLIHL